MLIATPTITRLYNPGEFGVLATYTAFISMFGSIICLRYEQAIVISKSDTIAFHAAALALFISIGVSILIPTLLEIVSQISYIQKNPVLQENKIYITPSIMLLGFGMILKNIAIRNQRFGIIGISTLTETLVNVIAKIAFAVGGSAIGTSLIISNIFSSLAGVLVLTKHKGKKEKNKFKTIKINRILCVLKKYRDFAIFGAPSILIGSAIWALPVIVLGHSFGLKVAGLYAVALSIMQIPTSVVGSGLTQVFLQKMTEAKRNATMSAEGEKLYKTMVKIAILPYALLAITTPTIVPIVFGAAWTEASVFLQIQIPWSILWFISTPFVVIYTVLERQKSHLKHNIIRLACRVLALMIGITLDDEKTTLYLLTISGVIFYAYKVMQTMSMITIGAGRLINVAIKEMAISLPLIICAYFMFEEENLKIYGLMFVVLTLTWKIVEIFKLEKTVNK